MCLILITSGAYVDSELVAEFGQLPPAFLPVGHRRLYEAQIESISHLEGLKVLTIPENYEVPEADKSLLAELSVRTLDIPAGMTLGNAILYTLELLSLGNVPVRILHGDTLTANAISSELDFVAVAPRPESYHWGTIDPQNSAGDKNSASNSEILAGYFSFSSEAELRRSLARARGDFIEALRIYDSEIPLSRFHIDDWLDFGHLQTYYRSRCSIQTQRVFNRLSLSFKSVKKSGANTSKIEAEAFWYQNIPSKLRLYTPAFLGQEQTVSGHPEYMLEYLPLPTLHELFVFGDLSEGSWRKILEGCNDFLVDCQADQDATPDTAIKALSSLVRKKSLIRLNEFSETSDISIDDEWHFNGKPTPSLRRIIEISTNIIDFADDQFVGTMHGDFCFPNIFYDFRTQRIRTIDPRGTLDGKEPTVWGDHRYDIAKMCHSIIGGYDFILANRFVCEGIETRKTTLTFAPSPSMEILEKLAKDMRFLGLNLLSPEILSISINLFVSMLPLHYDSPNRQKAFIVNALRLFTLLEEQL